MKKTIRYYNKSNQITINFNKLFVIKSKSKQNKFD